MAKTTPLGFWLRRADELITRRSNEALQSLGLTRYHWQTLNSLQQAGQVSQAQLHEMLCDFGDAQALGELLADLKERGLVVSRVDRGGARLGLTAAGVEMHARAQALQEGVRSRLMQGISAEEYSETLRVLQMICENLE